MNPFHNRPDEAELYDPLVGERMLELGGKINAPYTYKAFFEMLDNPPAPTERLQKAMRTYQKITAGDAL